MRNGPKLALKREAMLAAIRRVQPPQPCAQPQPPPGFFRESLWPSAAFSLSKTRNVAKLTSETSSSPSVISGFTGSGLSAVFRVKVRFACDMENSKYGTLAE